MDEFLKIINFSEVSRYITKGNRGTIRANDIKEKHVAELDKLFLEEIPNMWRIHRAKFEEKSCKLPESYDYETGV